MCPIHKNPLGGAVIPPRTPFSGVSRLFRAPKSWMSSKRPNRPGFREPEEEPPETRRTILPRAGDTRRFIVKRLIVIALVAGLIAGALVAPAGAAKKKKKAKAVATTLYMQGSETIGESESMSIVADGYLDLVPEEPEGSDTKSKGLLNYVRGPNDQCAGNSLWPVFVGRLSGTVKGDMTVVLNVASTPGEIKVRVWPDVNSQMCTQETLGSFDYPEPAAEAVVAVSPAETEIEIPLEKVNFKATSVLMVQVSPVSMDTGTDAGTFFPPLVGRVLYGSAGALSRIEFRCTPARGKSCTS